MIQKPRGTSDFFDEEFTQRYKLQNKFVDFYLNKKYKGLQTPIFEQKDLFVRSVGTTTDIVQKELFDLEKKSDDVLSLRPELTASIIRFFIESGKLKSLPKPIKVFSFGPCFRYERPQKGRRRQFDQLDVELLADDSFQSDLEIIRDCVEFFKDISIEDIIVNINFLGSEETRNKYSNILKEDFVSKKEMLCQTCQDRIERSPLRVLDCKNLSCQEIANQAITIQDVLSKTEKVYFEKLIVELKENNIEYKIDPYLVRGLDYYTGMIFEINLKEDISKLSSLGGGGRYNNLIEQLGGTNMPAVGLGYGFERIVDLLQDRGIEL